MMQKNNNSSNTIEHHKRDNFHSEIEKLNVELAASRKEMASIGLKLISINEELDNRHKRIKEAKDFSKTLMTIMNEPVAELDGNLVVRDANDAFCNLFMLARAAIIGAQISRILGTPPYRQEWEKLREKAGLPNSIIELKIIHRFPNQEERGLLVKAQCISAVEGPDYKFLIIISEPTEKQQSKEELKNDREAFKVMAENAPVMIWMTDTERRRTYFNGAWLRFTGKTLEQEINHGWESGIHPEDLERSLNIFNHSFDKKEGYKKEYRLRRKDGEYRWILSQGIPYYKNGSFAGYIGSCTDINYRVEQELQKDEFISVASHEFKTPLTSIKVYTELLQQLLMKGGNSDLAEFTGKIDNQIDKLTVLINDMLDVSRITGKTMFLNKELVNINELVTETISDLQPTLKRHRLISHLNPVKEILGDKKRLLQVLNNLISNAVKYSPEADEVLIFTEQSEEWVRVNIQDKGVGVPPADQKRIFNRFFRVQETAKTFPGIGLGLYITEEIIKRHKGKIEVESDTGKGSTFRFSLPVALGGSK